MTFSSRLIFSGSPTVLLAFIMMISLVDFGHARDMKVSSIPPAASSTTRQTVGDWNATNYIPSIGPTIVTLSEPDRFRIEIPSSDIYDHWYLNPHVDAAPQVRFVPPESDWKMTARLRIVAPAPGEFYQAGLFVYFSRYDMLYWGPSVGTMLSMDQSGRKAIIRLPFSGDEIELGISKDSELYRFQYRAPGGSWIVANAAWHRSEPPRFVGVFAKTWAPVHVIAEFSDFRLARVGSARDKLPPRVRSSLSSETAVIHIRNESSQSVEIYWIDYQGQLKNYGRMDPGGRVDQATFTGHTWEAQRNGRPISRFTAMEMESIWEIQ